MEKVKVIWDVVLAQKRNWVEYLKHPKMAKWLCYKRGRECNVSMDRVAHYMIIDDPLLDTLTRYGYFDTSSDPMSWKQFTK